MENVPDGILRNSLKHSQAKLSESNEVSFSHVNEEVNDRENGVNQGKVLNTFSETASILFDGEPVLQRPLAILLLSYILIAKETNRHRLAALFWEYVDDPAKRLKHLSDTLRPLRKLEGVIFDNEDYTEVYVSLGCDLIELQAQFEREDYQQCLDLCQSAFLEGFEDKKILNWEGRPRLLEWLFHQRDSVNYLILECHFSVAEAEIIQGSYCYTKQLWHYYITTDRTLLDYQGYARYITLFKAAKDKRYLAIEKDAIDEGYDDLDEDLPAALKHNIPYLSDALVGRNTELEELSQLLRSDQHRMVSIIGQSGVGKSYLAIAVARQLLGRRVCRDGCYWLALRDFKTDKGFLPALLRVLSGASEVNSYELIDHVIKHIGGKSMLLVLDNAEHVLAIKNILHRLIQRCPNLTILVTTQIRLASEWEHCYWLRGLSVPSKEASITLADLATRKYPVLYLFYKNAQRIRSDLVLQESDVDAIIEICQRLEGLPLGINLASSWLLTHSCKEIADLFTQPMFERSSTDIHRDLYTPLDYSWKLLTKKEQLLLMSLSVFVSGFRAEAAIKVANVNQNQLRLLIEKSFLRKVNRFEFHPLTHYFCIDKLNLEIEHKKQIEAKHARYYLTLTNDGWSELDIADSLFEERENIYKASRWAIKHEDTELLLQAMKLSRKSNFMMTIQETEAFFDDIKQDIEQPPSRLMQIIERVYLVNAYFMATKFHKVVDTAESLLKTLQHSFNLNAPSEKQAKQALLVDVYTSASSHLGWAYILRGDYSRAETAFWSLLDCPTTYQHIAHASVAYAQCYQGKHTEALNNIQVSLEWVKSSWAKDWTNISLGFVQWQVGQNKQAISHLLSVIEQPDSKQNLRRALFAAHAYLAEALLSDGQFSKAQARAEALLELLEENPWPEMQNQAKLVKATLYLLDEDYDAAWAHFLCVLQSSYELQIYMQSFRALIGLCDLLQKRHDPRGSDLCLFLTKHESKITYLDRQWLHSLREQWTCPKENLPTSAIPLTLDNIMVERFLTNQPSFGDSN